MNKVLTILGVIFVAMIGNMLMYDSLGQTWINIVAIGWVTIPLLGIGYCIYKYINNK